MNSIVPLIQIPRRRIFGVLVACELFHTLAVFTANYFDYSYQQEDENGIREYLIKTQNNDY